MIHFIKLYIFISFSFFLVATLGAREIEETFRKNIPVETATRLSVENRNGNIEVSTWDNDEVSIIAYKKVRAENEEQAQEIMDLLKIEINVMDDEVEVITEYPHSRDRHGSKKGFFGWLMGESSNLSYSVSYELKVPNKFDLDLKSTNGRVEVNDCEGRMRLETTNGKILAKDIKGSAKVSTTNGSVNVSFLKVVENDEMSFTSTNGSIKLYFPENIKADIKARTTNGSIKCRLDITDEWGSSRKKLNASVNGGGGLDIYVKTTNGSIKIDET